MIVIMLIVIIVFLMISILVWPRSTGDPWTSNRGTLESPLHWISPNMIIWCWFWWWWWSWRCFIQWRQWWWQRWPRPSKIRSLSQPTNTAFLLHLPHSQDHTLPYHFPISIPYIFVSMISFNFFTKSHCRCPIRKSPPGDKWSWWLMYCRYHKTSPKARLVWLHATWGQGHFL